MSWEKELEELAQRKALAAQLGGPEKVARHKAQGRLTVIAGSRDDLPENYELRGDSEITEIARMIQEPPPVRRFDRASLAGRSPRADLRTIVERLRAVGIQRLVAVDLSHADVGMPVVKLLATQLEFEHNGCARNVRSQRYEMAIRA